MEKKAMTGFIRTIGGAFLAFILLGVSTALAACPVGKGEGDTWCDNGTPWKCELCGSEYCSIIQSGSCHKDDAPFNASDLRSKWGEPIRLAQDDGGGQSAMEDLENAAEDGQEAVAAPTEEEAKAESNETFDTPHDSDGD
jgi:hypothetical protein